WGSPPSMTARVLRPAAQLRELRLQRTGSLLRGGRAALGLRLGGLGLLPGDLGLLLGDLGLLPGSLGRALRLLRRRHDTRATRVPRDAQPRRAPFALHHQVSADPFALHRPLAAVDAHEGAVLAAAVDLERDPLVTPVGAQR